MTNATLWQTNITQLVLELYGSWIIADSFTLNTKSMSSCVIKIRLSKAGFGEWD